MEKYRHWENAKYVKKSGCYIVCCHTTFSKTLYFHVLVVGKLGRLRKSHTTCKRCYLMLLLLDYHIPSFFSKKRQLLALLTPLTYITLYYWYFDVRYTKKYNARRRALYVIMLLFHYYYMQLQCYKRVLLEKEERGKKLLKNMKKRYASNNVHTLKLTSVIMLLIFDLIAFHLHKNGWKTSDLWQCSDPICSWNCQRLAIGIISDIWVKKRKADRFWKNRGHSGSTHIMAEGSLHHG